MKIKTEYTEASHITAGKEYEVVEYEPKTGLKKYDGAIIKDDDGYEIYVLLSGGKCEHLNGEGVWIVC